MNELYLILLLLVFILVLYCICIYKLNNNTRKNSVSKNKLVSKFSPEKEIYFKDYTRLLRDLDFNTPCDVSAVKNKKSEDRTIFISVASYRDDECPNTLNSIYTNAKYPKRIFVGICQQNHISDIDCMYDSNNPNVSIIRLNDFEAKGPTYARYICSKLYNKEDYYLQIDSHIHFVKDWDSKLIEMIDSIKTTNPKVVISQHPKDWKEENTTSDDTVSTFCTGNFGSVGVISYHSSIVANKGPCMLIPYCAAGFFFTYGCFLNEVPFDPNLPQLFEGEEGLFSIRLWTSGWDIYAPNRDICYHYYLRADKPKYWSNPDYGKYVNKSLHKVKVLMGLEEVRADDNFENDFKLYGLGSVRTLADYYRFIGFNRDTKTYSVNFCK
jgi:hypothetical protein